jgi:NMD protein affecting ribosome stability and mRNA decay
MRGFAFCARCGVPIPEYGPELCTTCQAAVAPHPSPPRRRLAQRKRRNR